jgi:hypothetical protein
LGWRELSGPSFLLSCPVSTKCRHDFAAEYLFDMMKPEMAARNQCSRYFLTATILVVGDSVAFCSTSSLFDASKNCSLGMATPPRVWRIWVSEGPSSVGYMTRSAALDSNKLDSKHETLDLIKASADTGLMFWLVLLVQFGDADFTALLRK